MSDDSKPTGLREGIRALTGEDRLSADELASLRRLAEEQPQRPGRRRWLAVAAAAGGAALLGSWGASQLWRDDNAQRMADEVAYNHLAASPLDLDSNRLDDLRGAFMSLGFSLLDAQSIEGVPGQLIGGRFCSVASVPAALLRYRDGDRTHTVYQARFDSERHRGAADIDGGGREVVRHARGVSVCLCNIQGVLVAVASSSSSAAA